jgi:hypothetical protein
VQRRTYPQPRGPTTRTLGLGVHRDRFPWGSRTRKRVGSEAVALLAADPVSPRRAGHHPRGLAARAPDPRVGPDIRRSSTTAILAREANYAGTSFAPASKKIGAAPVRISGRDPRGRDATLPHGLATFAFDDEGVEGGSAGNNREGRPLRRLI